MNTINQTNKVNKINMMTNSISKKIFLNSYPNTIPNGIIMKNPFFNRSPIQNRVLKTIQFNNRFVRPKTVNNMNYLNLMSNKNTITYQQYPQFNINKYAQNSIYRNKSIETIPNSANFAKFQTIQEQNHAYRNKNLVPIYRRIVYRKKN